ISGMVGSNGRAARPGGAGLGLEGAGTRAATGRTGTDGKATPGRPTTAETGSGGSGKRNGNGARAPVSVAAVR
ncbi:hypothetical protein K4H02_22680, partial [Mycobacterium tuberculosis]|nr:hypothetical protein [Mycobacterium tuberculosis]